MLEKSWKKFTSSDVFPSKYRGKVVMKVTYRVSYFMRERIIVHSSRATTSSRSLKRDAICSLWMRSSIRPRVNAKVFCLRYLRLIYNHSWNSSNDIEIVCSQVSVSCKLEDISRSEKFFSKAAGRSRVNGMLDSNLFYYKLKLLAHRQRY